MRTMPHWVRHGAHRMLAGAGCVVVICLMAAPVQADGWHHRHRGDELRPGNLLVSTSDYVPADITAGVTPLPPGCATAPIGSCGTAVADGNDFPSVLTTTASMGSLA